jgi:uncharacterized protein (TIGR02186 family)
MMRVLCLLLALAAPAAAEEIVAGLSRGSVAITADFTGEEILIYGAVKRQAPPPAGPLDVAITVEGPSSAVAVRRKARVWGIWMNTDSVWIDAAPTLYAVASTGPLDAILSPETDLVHRISIPRAIRATGAAGRSSEAPAFVAALLRLRAAEGRYEAPGRGVQLVEDTLFRTDIRLPPDLTEGDYRVRMFLLRGGRVVDRTEAMIPVRKAGIERAIFTLSQSQPLLYGLLSVVLAVAAGWGASAAFRLLRW